MSLASSKSRNGGNVEVRMNWYLIIIATYLGVLGAIAILVSIQYVQSDTSCNGFLCYVLGPQSYWLQWDIILPAMVVYPVVSALGIFFAIKKGDTYVPFV